jgi:hypothetical protein
MVTPLPNPTTYTPCENPRAYKWKRNLCKCVGCRDEASAEYRRWQLRSLQGTVDPQVDAAETIDAIRRLRVKRRKHHFSVAAIARHCKVTDESIWSLIREDHLTCRQSIRDGVKELIEAKRGSELLVDRRRGDQVDVARAQRVIQGLMLQGYPQTWIAEKLGFHPNSQVSAWLCGKYKYISRENEAKLLLLAKEVGIKRGPNERIATLARNRGYVGLANWDDIT